jgi:hypothetical protein
VKAAVVRGVATRFTVVELDEGIRAITEEEREVLDIEGDDIGERLTHLLLARRIRARIDAGEDPKSAFRAEMGQVRDTLANG